MYAVRNSRIIEIDQINKQSKRGTGTWVVFKGMKKQKLVSNGKIFDTKKEAEEYLDTRKFTRTNDMSYEDMERYFKKQEDKQKELDEVMDKIWEEFGVTVKFLSKPCTVEDAQELYYKIKQDKDIRNIEIY